MQSQTEMVHRLLDGQPGAFDAFYYAHVDRVQRHLGALLGADPDSEDVVQQIFVQAHRALRDFRGESSLETWLHRITVNAAFKHLRRRACWWRWRDTSDSLGLTFGQPPEQPDIATSRSQTWRQISSQLDQLSPKKRVAFVLHDVEGYTLREIAELTDSSLHAVAERVRAARRDLKKLLGRRRGLDIQESLA
jgi:RNA polymerase sigma-70 factor (ECF subfamily)